MYSLDYWSLNKQDNSLINHSVKSIVSNIENGNSYYQIFKKQNYQTITDPVSAIADSIKNNFSDLLVIGMGGANLNPQMLVNFLGRQQNIKIHFLNNTDPMFFDDIMSIIDLKNTAMLAISNSGNTLETNSLVGCVIQEYKKHNFSDIGKRCFFITNTQNGTLKDIANEIEGQLIEHQENISGRYSTLSVVTLLIGLIANIDMQQYILGANRVIDDFCHNMEDSKPAISANLIFHCSKNILVNIGYLQKFNTFLEWYSQIISESLGKGGNGYTPVRGLGPNDQHSMLQLYLDGPQDKLFSLFYVNELDEKFLNYKTYNSDNLKYLANKKLSDINNANFQATLSALKIQNLPIRVFTLDSVSAMSFGALVTHFMFEIVLISHLMDINPFNQPGVELIKKESMSLMNQFSKMA